MNCFTPGTNESTYGGNPLACKVAIAAIDAILEEEMVENAAKMGKILQCELKERLNKTRVTEVRGRGLLAAVVFDIGTRDEIFALELSYIYT